MVTISPASRVALASSRNVFLLFKPHPPITRPLSSASPYPLYYELIRYRPARQPLRHRPARDALSSGDPKPDPADADDPAMDRAKRKYYRKRDQRMFGGDADVDARGGGTGETVELKPEVVDFPRLHAREQELYFHDAFAYPWEKDKHYRMVYQLEKKYFPEQSLDRAFVDPDVEPETKSKKRDLKKKSSVAASKESEERDERALVFFDDGDNEKEKGKEKDISEKKVQEFFKCLKKVPSGGGGGGSAGRRDAAVAAEMDKGGEPFLVSRRTELPPRWDGPYGTVLLVDKPKG